jgi:SAM-dependent methyltransferase
MVELFQFRGYEIPVHLVMKTGSGTHNFEQIADWHISQIQKYVGINAADNVVEIGCGIGRVAIPLTEILTCGTYLGTEVIRPSVDWCSENITARHPNFTFIHHDIHDTLHNPNGTLHAKDIRLPSEDGTVNLILLLSVFTHMFRDEIIHYMREFRRMLKPTGRVYASCFLVNSAVLDAVRDEPRLGWKVQFRHAYGEGCYINSEEEPRGAVAFEDGMFMAMINQGRLALDDVLWGNWSGARDNPRSGQDVTILRVP